MLQAYGLAAIRGERLVFAGVDFDLPAGGALLLTGPNGAGKSSLLRALAGLLSLEAGRLLWRGADALVDRAAQADRITYVGHRDGVKPSLTAAENLRFWGNRRAVVAALAALDLAGLADLPARLLSAGQQRRLALARLALSSTPIWLLDEPTLGLDAAAVDRLGDLLAAHRLNGGVVLAATHLPLPLPDVATLALE